MQARTLPPNLPTLENNEYMQSTTTHTPTIKDNKKGPYPPLQDPVLFRYITSLSGFPSGDASTTRLGHLRMSPPLVHTERNMH